MLKLGRVTKVKVLFLVLVFVFSVECTIGMVWGLTALKHYGNKALCHYGTMAIRHFVTMELWQ